MRSTCAQNLRNIARIQVDDKAREAVRDVDLDLNILRMVTKSLDHQTQKTFRGSLRRLRPRISLCQKQGTQGFEKRFSGRRTFAKIATRVPSRRLASWPLISTISSFTR